jgi:hypothetical protein
VAVVVPRALVLGLHPLCGAVTPEFEPRLISLSAFIGRMKRWLDLPALEVLGGFPSQPLLDNGYRESRGVPLHMTAFQLSDFLDDLKDLANRVGFVWTPDLRITSISSGLSSVKERADDSVAPSRATSNTENDDDSVCD